MPRGRGMQKETNFIFSLARTAAKSIKAGYYDDLGTAPAAALKRRSLSGAISRSRRMPVLAEIKFTSPAEGKLRDVGDVAAIAKAYERGGVAGISVLTEPKHFQGDIRFLPLVKEAVRVPVLMKDIIIDPVQIQAGADMGADAVLFIAAIFMNRLAKVDPEEMFDVARGRGLEVLLEAHTKKEFEYALGSQADVVGINNRDLDTLEVSLDTTRKLLKSKGTTDKPVISESGISARQEMVDLAKLGADGFLVGSSLMKSSNLEAKVRSLTGKRA